MEMDYFEPGQFHQFAMVRSISIIRAPSVTSSSNNSTAHTVSIKKTRYGIGKTRLQQIAG
jgi:ferredoxin-NADP reductase